MAGRRVSVSVLLICLLALGAAFGPAGAGRVSASAHLDKKCKHKKKCGKHKPKPTATTIPTITVDPGSLAANWGQNVAAHTVSGAIGVPPAPASARSVRSVHASASLVANLTEIDLTTADASLAAHLSSLQAEINGQPAAVKAGSNGGVAITPTQPLAWPPSSAAPFFTFGESGLPVLGSADAAATFTASLLFSGPNAPSAPVQVTVTPSDMTAQWVLGNGFLDSAIQQGSADHQITSLLLPGVNMAATPISVLGLPADCTAAPATAITPGVSIKCPTPFDLPIAFAFPASAVDETHAGWLYAYDPQGHATIVFSGVAQEFFPLEKDITVLFKPTTQNTQGSCTGITLRKSYAGTFEIGPGNAVSLVFDNGATESGTIAVNGAASMKGGQGTAVSGFNMNMTFFGNGSYAETDALQGGCVATAVGTFFPVLGSNSPLYPDGDYQSNSQTLKLAHGLNLIANLSNVTLALPSGQQGLLLDSSSGWYKPAGTWPAGQSIWYYYTGADGTPVAFTAAP